MADRYNSSSGVNNQPQTQTRMFDQQQNRPYGSGRPAFGLHGKEFQQPRPIKNTTQRSLAVQGTFNTNSSIFRHNQKMADRYNSSSGVNNQPQTQTRMFDQQ
jgi:hypothetical protein